MGRQASLASSTYNYIFHKPQPFAFGTLTRLSPIIVEALFTDINYQTFLDPPNQLQMVTIEQVRASNAQISKSLPAGLVAVFVGGTNGVGEVTIKQFVKHTIRPRVFLVGRSKEAGNRIIAECKAINPDGIYVLILKELSLLKNVDEVCKEILAQETHINLLFLTIGTLQAGLSKYFSQSEPLITS